MVYQKHPKLIMGAVELCDLPELGIENMHVRVDTGAATSSLHVDNIKKFTKNKIRFVNFDLHPDIHNVEKVVRCTAPVVITKTVKNSSADSEKRVVITTLFRLGKKNWPIKLNLTDRSEMTYMMLLGREAMKGRVLVDPEFEYMLGEEEFEEEAVSEDSEEE